MVDKKAFILLVVMAAMLLSASCIRRPKHVLSDSDMAPILADMELAEAYMRTNHGVTQQEREALMNGIIDKHGVSREDFDSTMNWYGRNIDKYYAVCEQVQKELAKKKRKLAGNNSVEIESNDLWPYVRMSYMPVGDAGNGINFSIPTADVTSGQRLQWKLRTYTPQDATALLGVEYEDGQQSYVTSALRGRNLDVVLQTDTGRQVTRIFGNLLVKQEQRRPLWVDSIALQSLPYDTTEYFTIYSQHDYSRPVARRKPRKAVTDTLMNALQPTTNQTPTPVPAPTSAMAPAVSHQSPPRPGATEIPRPKK